MMTLDEVIIGIKEQMGLGDSVLIDALYYLKELQELKNTRIYIPEGYIRAKLGDKNK